MKIGFIGAGNMGEAYIGSLSKEHDIFFYELSHERAEYIKNTYNVNKSDKIEDLVNNAEIIVVAVKPQVIESVLYKIDKCDIKNQIILSIAAGIKIEKFEKSLGDDKKIVRAMPNTPALIKKGITAVSFNDNVSDALEKNKIIEVLKSTGTVVEIEEKHMDAVTAVSGSGPAYAFLLINSIADGGVRMGLSKKVALQLAAETFAGAAEMILKTGKHPEELKDMVTSPGGTTAAGLFELETHGIRGILMKAVDAAAQKSEKLSK